MHYNTPDAQRPLPDVERRVEVRAGLMAARDAFEGGLVGAVSLVDAAARAAFTRRVAGIDKADRNPGPFRFVSQETAQLGKGPIAKPCPLVAASRYPSANALEVFESNATSGAFSVLNERLRYAMVGLGLEPPLFAGQFPQPALGRFGAALLQASAPLGIMLADPLNLSAGINRAVTGGGKAHNAKVNADPILGIELFGLGNVAGRGEDPLATNEAEINLALAERHQATLVLTHHDGNNDAAFQGPQADRATILHKAQDAVVVGLSRIRTKDRYDFAVYLERIGDLGDAAHRSLGRQSEVGAQGAVRQLVHIKLAKRLGLKACGGKPRARLVAARQRRGQALGLLRRRQHFYGGDQFHGFQYGRPLIRCQVRRADARGAIPLPPEVGSLSRRFR